MIKPINNPELTVGIDDNFQNLMEEYGDFVWLIFILGIILGIIISLIFYQIYDFLRDKKPEEEFTMKVKETQNSNIQRNGMENSNFSNNCEEATVKKDNTKKEEKDMTFFVIIFLLVSFLIVAIVISCATMNDNSGGIIKDVFSKKATTDDITLDYYEIPSITGSDKYYVILQANEKIEDLVIEIDFLDKDKKILKTEEIEIGKVTPGNEYKFELNQSGMNFNQLDKTQSFRTRVTEGYIID